MRSKTSKPASVAGVNISGLIEVQTVGAVVYGALCPGEAVKELGFR